MSISGTKSKALIIAQVFPQATKWLICDGSVGDDQFVMIFSSNGVVYLAEVGSINDHARRFGN